MQLTPEIRLSAEQVLQRYARAVDRSDWPLLRSLYHPDALIDHGQYQGDVDGFVEFVKGRREGIVHTAHHLSQVLVEPLSATEAAVEAYGWAVQTFAAPSSLVPPGAAGVTYRSTYRYVDRLGLRDGRWGFLETHLVLGDLRVEQHDEAPKRRPGRSQLPTTEDPLYGLLARWRAQSSTGRDAGFD